MHSILLLPLVARCIEIIDVCWVGNPLLLGHCPFGLDVALILRAPRPPLIQGQFKK